MAGSSGRLYGRDRWNPGRICGQIWLLQALFYLLFMGATTLGCLAAGLGWNFMLMFSPEVMDVFTPMGWVAIAGQVFTALATAGMLAVVVERVKKCMDFTFTLYVLHLAVCWVVTGAFPASGVWWLVFVLSFIITAALGEYLCLQREMQEISIDDIMRRRQGSGATTSAAAPPSSKASDVGGYAARRAGARRSGEAAAQTATTKYRVSTAAPVDDGFGGAAGAGTGIFDGGGGTLRGIFRSGGGGGGYARVPADDVESGGVSRYSGALQRRGSTTITGGGIASSVLASGATATPAEVRFATPLRQRSVASGGVAGGGAAGPAPSPLLRGVSAGIGLPASAVVSGIGAASTAGVVPTMGVSTSIRTSNVTSSTAAALAATQQVESFVLAPGRAGGDAGGPLLSRVASVESVLTSSDGGASGADSAELLSTVGQLPQQLRNAPRILDGFGPDSRSGSVVGTQASEAARQAAIVAAAASALGGGGGGPVGTPTHASSYSSPSVYRLDSRTAAFAATPGNGSADPGTGLSPPPSAGRSAYNFSHFSTGGYSGAVGTPSDALGKLVKRSSVAGAGVVTRRGLPAGQQQSYYYHGGGGGGGGPNAGGEVVAVGGSAPGGGRGSSGAAAGADFASRLAAAGPAASSASGGAGGGAPTAAAASAGAAVTDATPKGKLRPMRSVAASMFSLPTVLGRTAADGLAAVATGLLGGGGGTRPPLSGPGGGATGGNGSQQ